MGISPSFLLNHLYYWGRAFRDNIVGPEVAEDLDRAGSAESALRAITTDAAWQVHGDDRGSLEVGKKADFAVLSANPWTSDPATWADIKVHETRIDGTDGLEYKLTGVKLRTYI